MYVFIHSSIGQGIRMHYTELTENERIAYRTVIDNLISLGIIQEYAEYHADPNQDGSDGNSVGSGDESQIHIDEEFLPWHMWFLLEFEWKIKAINSSLNIPYWDWTGSSDPIGVDSRSSNGPLWANNQISSLSWNSNFLDSYNTQLSLQREFGGATLPSSNEVNNVLNLSSFTNFRSQLEFQTPNLHGRPHGWVGDDTSPIQSGSMSDIFRSPMDPVFYFHHAMVDKIWQDWTEMGRTSSFSDSDMPTFDGSVTGFPYVNPASIIDSRSLGIFYSDAVSQQATLSNYTVTNNKLSIEKFIYRYNIVARDFTIPSGKTTHFISPQSITIEKNFEAAAGAVFEMKTN